MTVLLLAAALSVGAEYTPTADYRRETVRGWTVRVHPDLAADAELRSRVVELLDSHLYRIGRVVPSQALAKLKQVPIWLEKDHGKFECACYHPSRAWLSDNGVNPDKAKAVEIADARNFLDWTREQPWMVLHELAHAYHDRELDFDRADVVEAYEAAKRAGKLGKALRTSGRRKILYAATNAKEYFAEWTEAYFGVNDFHPFVRSELVLHDERGARLIESLWGVAPPHEVDDP